jgi:hypothetical protein
MPVIPINKVVDKKNNRKRGAEEEERHAGLMIFTNIYICRLKK